MFPNDMALRALADHQRVIDSVLTPGVFQQMAMAQEALTERFTNDMLSHWTATGDLLRSIGPSVSTMNAIAAGVTETLPSAMSAAWKTESEFNRFTASIADAWRANRTAFDSLTNTGAMFSALGALDSVSASAKAVLGDRRWMDALANASAAFTPEPSVSTQHLNEAFLAWAELASTGETDDPGADSDSGATNHEPTELAKAAWKAYVAIVILYLLYGGESGEVAAGVIHKSPELALSGMLGLLPLILISMHGPGGSQ